jgi:hypothetical protein
MRSGRGSRTYTAERYNSRAQQGCADLGRRRRAADDDGPLARARLLELDTLAPQELDLLLDEGAGRRALEAAHLAIGGDNPVARDERTEGVLGEGRADRPGRAADGGREGAVRGCPSGRQLGSKVRASWSASTRQPAGLLRRGMHPHP